MKVIVDNKIPYIKGVIETLADEVVYLPGKEFTPEAVRDADALIIRTRTLCNRKLLEGSRVKFIGTATIGFDHIDTDYCREAGIAWSNCPGCNAGAVEQYIHSVLLLLQKEKGVRLDKACLGIVGVGHVGSRIAKLAERLGIRTLLNDPPRESLQKNNLKNLENTSAFLENNLTNLEELADECDIISFHVPLSKQGEYPTFHLADGRFFHALKKKPYIINTSRGEVMDTQAVLYALDHGEIAGAVIDVWENEPNISRELLDKVFIGTPHIAGYSADGKANATRMVLEAFCRRFGRDAAFCIEPPVLPHAPYCPDEEERQLQMYNPQADCAALRLHPDHFEQLRGEYPLRRE